MKPFLVRRCFFLAVIAAVLFVATPAWSQTDTSPLYDTPAPSAAAMFFDAVIVRPLSLVATVAGTGLFLVTLPISALGHNTSQAGDRLVLYPAEYTFTRPLGDFDADTAPES